MHAPTRTVFAAVLAAAAVAAAAPDGLAQSPAPLPIELLGAWSWRQIGPASGRLRGVLADNAFPYRVCGVTDAAAAVCGPPSPDADRLWHALDLTGSWLAADPNDPDSIYGGGVQRLDRRTMQRQDVSPVPEDGEPAGVVGPLLFSPTDSRTLYYATTVLRRTNNGGLNWIVMSPDLSRGAPPAPGAPASAPAISAVAASSVDGRVIWTGTSDGAIHVTRDAGVTWTDVTPAALAASASAAVLQLEASHFDPSTAYAIVSQPAGPAGAPRALRTRDAGATWSDISAPPSADMTVVREDPLRRGLLFAGTTRTVVVSADDGTTWQPLTLDLPRVTVTHLTIKDADLIAATDGHGLWILDDFSPLRQLTPDVARAGAFLFRPPVAWRARGTSVIAAGTDAPRPAAGAGGVAFAYVVGPSASGPISLEVVETVSGEVIRRYSSTDRPAGLSDAPGLHRVVWDLRSAPVRGRGVLVEPGTYQVRLTAAGRLLRQAVIVRLDPRLRVSVTDLHAQALLSKRVYRALGALDAAGTDREPGSAAAREAAADALASALDALQQSDTRPTPALAARATAAIERADLLLNTPRP
jgi:hypothetical protein